MITSGPILKKDNHTIVKNVVPEAFCALLADYTRFKANARPNIKKNIDPLDNVHREYGDPMMELLLEKLTPIVEQATGLELWPTLSFYYVYKHGTQLRKHKDRSSCQFVAGIVIGTDETFKAQQHTWPLMLTLQGKAKAVALEIGDVLIFKGHETEHWREVFSGNWFSSAIFGYVDKNGPFAFQKYDQRAALGKPHVGMFRWSLQCLIQKYRLR